jgi:hypothetical protein
MTAKKPVSKVKPKLIKKEPIKKEYKPIFCIPIVEKKVIKRDINYYGVKQYLKNKLGLDLFKKLKDDIADRKLKKVVVKKESFDYKKYYEDMNNCILEYWNKYCVWWSNHVRR